MGRVSKHKKIKAIDPFYKGPRREQSREENLPPGDLDDQPVPKSLLRIVQPGSTGKSHKETQPQRMADTQSGGTSTSGKVTDEKEHSFVRRRGESLNDYLDRIDIESRERMVELARRSKGTSDRRKKYYEKRRKRIESKKGRKQESEDVLEFKDLKDDVKFGEVVNAPPTFSAKPRRKTPKTTTVIPSKLPSSADHEKKVTFIGLKRKQDLEDERDRLIQEYRKTKRAKSSQTTKQLTL